MDTRGEMCCIPSFIIVQRMKATEMVIVVLPQGIGAGNRNTILLRSDCMMCISWNAPTPHILAASGKIKQS